MKNKKQYQFLALVTYVFLLVFYQSPAQSGPSQQQEYLLTGTVTDSYGPMPGVHVLIKGTNTGTFTDKDGEFSLTVTATNTLVFSYLGYHTLEVSILGKTTLEVELQPEATQLQEVEVNAGYYTVKERERTGSISRVTSEEIGIQPVSNPLAALQGRMTGVNITQTSGVPGAGFNIQIRGRNSIREDGNE
ncbi:MAG TPA: carboxypeptidase-like regulatory domain-containing protein, partial [Arenibacter sp.]|nr:carboxypeptidase-like regulatory domain-containing protein [Arenibacter sp.]